MVAVASFGCGLLCGCVRALRCARAGRQRVRGRACSGGGCTMRVVQFSIVVSVCHAVRCRADERKRLLSFVVVGGGPTGVEVAAELYDMIHDDLRYVRQYCLYVLLAVQPWQYTVPAVFAATLFPVGHVWRRLLCIIQAAVPVAYRPPACPVPTVVHLPLTFPLTFR